MNKPKEKKNLKRDYEEKIENKRKGYELTARMIGYTIQKMKEASLISGDVKVTGRLKSFKSASENYKKKAEGELEKLPDNFYKGLLRDFLDFAISRKN